MAKHKLSAMFSDLRGKLNGSKFSKSRSCHTLTNKIKGSNPQTSYQGRVRAAFRVHSATWRTISQSLILAWNQAAQEESKSNAFGDKYKPSGFQYFMKLNMLRSEAGLPPCTTPPQKTPVTFPNGNDTVDIANLKIELDLDTPLDANTKMLVYMSAPFSFGNTSKKKSCTRLITVLDSTTVFPYNCYDDYVAVFGTSLKPNHRMRKRLAWLMCAGDPQASWGYWGQEWENMQESYNSQGSWEW
jgi:hypothetical protein